jgi:hypothetical protein
MVRWWRLKAGKSDIFVAVDSDPPNNNNRVLLEHADPESEVEEEDGQARLGLVKEEVADCDGKSNIRMHKERERKKQSLKVKLAPKTCLSVRFIYRPVERHLKQIDQEALSSLLVMINYAF